MIKKITVLAVYSIFLVVIPIDNRRLEAIVKPSFYALLSLRMQAPNRPGVKQLALGRSHKAPESK